MNRPWRFLVVSAAAALSLFTAGCSDDCDTFCSNQAAHIDECLPEFEQDWADVGPGEWESASDFVGACRTQVEDELTRQVEETCTNADTEAECANTLQEGVFAICTEELDFTGQSCTDFWRDNTDFTPQGFDPERPPPEGDDDDSVSDDDDSASDDDDSATDDDDSATDDDDAVDDDDSATDDDDSATDDDDSATDDDDAVDDDDSATDDDDSATDDDDAADDDDSATDDDDAADDDDSATDDDDAADDDDSATDDDDAADDDDSATDDDDSSN